MSYKNGKKSIKAKLSVPKFKNVNELFRYLVDIQPSYNEETNELDVLIVYAKKAYGTIKTIVCPDDMKHFTYNPTTDAEYWYSVKKDTLKGNELLNECYQDIVFNIFCTIDGASSENDFYVIRTIFDEANNYNEFHPVWCEFLRYIGGKNMKFKSKLGTRLLVNELDDLPEMAED